MTEQKPPDSEQITGDVNKQHPTVLRDAVIEALHSVYDPEIPVDIFDLGLIYEVKVSDEGQVDVLMTLTSPNCPAAQYLPAEVECRIKELSGVKDVAVRITFDPPWDKSMMSEAAMFQMGFF